MLILGIIKISKEEINKFRSKAEASIKRTAYIQNGLKIEITISKN